MLQVGWKVCFATSRERFVKRVVCGDPPLMPCSDLRTAQMVRMEAQAIIFTLHDV